MTEQEISTLKAKAFEAGYRQAIDDYTKFFLEARRDAFEEAMRTTGRKLEESMGKSIEAYVKK